jgi:ornithine cyclodeaminase/alanine dehydrogenase-like protein (mu-crystallin family)
MEMNAKGAADINKGDLTLRVLSESDVRMLLNPSDLLEALEQGFHGLSQGTVQAPDRPEITVPQKGFVLSMPAWQPGMSICVKMVSVFENNLNIALPNHLALINLFDPATGKPVCIMDGTYITAIRTSASAILSVKLLSRKESRRATILGAGVQGREHLRLLPLVRGFDEILIGSLYVEDAERLAQRDKSARAIEDFEAAVRSSDVVCLCTHSYSPVIEDSWLSAGTHVSSVGYAPPEGELPKAVAQKNKLYVEARTAFSPPPAGCGELQGIDQAKGTELGEILSEKRPGRESQSEITVYKAMGIAMEDMVAANLVYRRAEIEKIGVTVRI